MPRRSILMLACREGYSHRVSMPTLHLTAGGWWVGLACAFGQVERLHCLAPDPTRPGRIAQHTTTSDDPYCWPTREAAQAALATWLEQDD